MMELPKLMLIARGRAPMVQLQEMWSQSDCAQLYELVGPRRLRSMLDICEALLMNNPAVVVIGDGFGKQPFSGDELVKRVRSVNAGCRIIVCITSEVFATAIHSEVDFRIEGSPEELRAALLTIRS